jgi:fructosamine-3-kinase
MIAAELSNIEKKFRNNRTGQINDIRHYARGHGASLYLVDTNQGERLIAKLANSSQCNLEIEARMLSYLKRYSGIPVPEVYIAEKDFILMEYIQSNGALDEKAMKDAAHYIANLHSIKAPYFGFDYNTTIGPYTQPNTKSQNWIEFFRDQRLLYMALKAREQGAIQNRTMAKLESLAGKLEQYIDAECCATEGSLVHGDIWSGNVLGQGDKINGFIDPAIYYADPEIELSFICLFRTFNQYFFECYQEINPINDGFFELRKDIYNLYPLLVHSRLYGSSYEKQIIMILERFIGT